MHPVGRMNQETIDNICQTQWYPAKFYYSGNNQLKKCHHFGIEAWERVHNYHNAVIAVDDDNNNVIIM